MIETPVASTTTTSGAMMDHCPTTGWSRIPSSKHKKQHTSPTTRSREAELQRMKDTAGAVVDYPGSPTGRRIPPKRKNHSTGCQEPHTTEYFDGTTEPDSSSTVWRRIPIKGSTKRISGRATTSDLPGTDDCGGTTTSAPSTTATPPLLLVGGTTLKRGGSMRNLLRHKRRSEKESHSRGDTAVRRDRCSKDQRRMTMERINAIKSLSELLAANEEAAHNKHTTEQHQENKLGPRDDDEGLISLASHEQKDSIISHGGVLVVLPEQKRSQCIALPTMDEDTDMGLEGGDVIQQVHGLCIQEGSGSFGVYSGSVIQSSHVPHGYGLLVYQDGRTFDGTFARGAKVHGTMQYLDGSTYQGQFLDGVRQGHGSYSFAGGVLYRGDFDNDRMHGPGSLAWPNGRRFVGYWKKGTRHGPGKYFRPDGTLHREGVWKRGALIAP